MGNSCGGAKDRAGHFYRLDEMMPANFQLVDLAELSKYPSETASSQTVSGLFTDTAAYREYGSFLTKLLQSKEHFEDSNYRLMGQTARLSQFYNRRTQPKMFASSGSEALEQANKEFTYLSAVFCFIANNTVLLRDLMLVEPNESAFYVAKLFSNGAPLNVAVDEQVPRDKESLLHSKPLQYELWMFVLEKAWTKLVGGYDVACGLSPEDAFEEILGAPAYSYIILAEDRRSRENFEFLIRRKKSENMCVILTARQGDYEPSGMLSRQVFYLEGFQTCAGLDFAKLRCPYTNFRFSGELQQRAKRIDELDRLVGYNESHPGTIFLSPNEIFSIFEFCTIGYYKPNYRASSYSFASDFNEPVFFRLSITKKEQINLRICQYYEGYLRHNINYDYSPVYIQLFREDNRTLVAEGCNRSIYRCKSANVFEEIFEELEPGRYFLRVNVEWLFPEKLREAKLVSYSSHQVEIVRIVKEEGTMGYNLGVRVHDELLKGLISSGDIKQIEDLEYGAKWLRNNVYLFYNNMAANELRMIVNLKKSVNLVPVEGDFSGKCISIHLEPHASRLIELRKQDVHLEGSLGEYMIEMV